MKHYKCFTRDYADQIVKELNDHQDWHPVSIVYDERNWDILLENKFLPLILIIIH